MSKIDDAYQAALRATKRQRLAARQSRSSFGVFKKTHRGFGIYFSDGRFNVEGGSGQYSTIKKAIEAIDTHVVESEKKSNSETIRKISSGEYLVARKNQDGSVSIIIPGIGTQEFPNINQARGKIFDLEAQYNKSILWA